MDPFALVLQFLCLWGILYAVVFAAKFYCTTKARTKLTSFRHEPSLLLTHTGNRNQDDVERAQQTMASCPHFQPKKQPISGQSACSRSSTRLKSATISFNALPMLHLVSGRFGSRLVRSWLLLLWQWDSWLLLMQLGGSLLFFGMRSGPLLPPTHPMQ